MKLPQVSVFSLGGTISSTSAGGSGVEPTLTGQALVDAVPETAKVADISAESFRQIPGWEITLDDLIDLSARIKVRIEEGAAGIVVTQGTDSIEETAFVLDLLVDHEAPIVVTGAMRNPTLPGADGPANLLASVQVAASERARNIGTVVVLNDEIHAAQFVQKTHTSNPATFRSALTGPVGWVSEGRVRVALHPVRRFKISLEENSHDHPVCLLTITMGDEGRLLSAVEQQGYAGLVIEGQGGGHVPSTMADMLEGLAERMPVVLASRTGSGEVLHGTYSFPGSEMDLLQRGLISAGFLDGLKARLFLTLLLKSGSTLEEIRDSFDSWLVH